MKSTVKGGINDLENFLGEDLLKKNKVNYDKPLETQGFMDSMEVIQYIIHLEQKYAIRLTREEIKSITIYEDLLNILASK